VSFVALKIDMRIFLVGYMGVGKSTIGKKLASAMGLRFRDLDEVVARNENLSITQIIDNKGEEYFRKVERLALIETTKMEHVLIATGGGVPCFSDNMEQINSSGVSIYLKLDEKSLVKRLSQGGNSRPLLKGKSGAQLVEFVSDHLASRVAYYEKAKLSFDVFNLDAEGLVQLANKIKALS
jgi:shikimate kinase